MLTEAQATDEAEDRQYGPAPRGDERPEALRDRRSWRARWQACQERLTRAAATGPQQAKIETRQAEEAATGQKKRGRKPTAPEAAAHVTAKANVTDTDRRIMQTHGRVRARLQRPGGGDGGTEHRGGQGDAGGP